ncbi:MAG TPA: histidine phosphatase family protein [Longimicrobium sp.]|nr:histidine phosphatase family protein [Longimicrobium sp.]
MPTNANILLIRHGEKPETGTGLAPAGQARAQAYVAYFQNYPIGGDTLKLQYIFATKDSKDSHRPRLTVTPLADALGLKIDDKHADEDYAKVADDLLAHGKYDGSNVLVCWHHGHLLELAARLGATSGTSWPAEWPGDVYGWVLQLCYGADGTLATPVCLSQQLMYDDCGQQPPNG